MEHEFLDPSQDIPLGMPILDRWVEQQHGRLPLRGVTALFIQHQRGNQVPQALAMLKLGLDPARLFWLDVPYSSNARVRDAIVNAGVPRSNLIVADDYRVLDAYAPYQRARVQRLIRGFLDHPPEKLLVLDDGAYFLEAAACFRSRLPCVTVVEQTTRGMIKIESSPALRHYAESVPVVDVARSTPKRTLEPPFIGKAVCAALLRRLGAHFSPARNDRCLVLGLGAIGSQVVRFAEEYLGFARGNIQVFDPDASRMLWAVERGYSGWKREDLNTRFRLVIGCSGRASFKVDDYINLEDGATLASASSGSVELSREDFIELADSSQIDDIKILREGLNEQDVESDIHIQLVDREAVFLSGGFPVNFSSKPDKPNCVPSRYMQPTVTMMVAASVQAVESTAGGILEVDAGFCTWIDKEFRAELGDVAHGLLPLPPTSCAGASA